MMVTVMMVMVMMLVVVMLVVVMLVVVMLVVVSVCSFAFQGGRMFLLRMLRLVRRVLRRIVRCSGVNVEFHTRDSGAGLTLEMQVTIAQLQF
jgi:hypothetical protein